MSTSNHKVSNYFKFNQLLEEAITKNTCPPREGEVFTQSKKLRVSGELEGDSQLGVLLFVGVSAKYGVPRAETVDFLGVEVDEYDYKINKFSIEHVAGNQRLINKTKLIFNYIKYYAKSRGVLIQSGR
jgi:hypothetical protein